VDAGHESFIDMTDAIGCQEQKPGEVLHLPQEYADDAATRKICMLPTLEEYVCLADQQHRFPALREVKPGCEFGLDT